MTHRYKKALEVANDASALYSRIATRFRNREIGVKTYLAARAVHAEAKHAFDVEAEKEVTS